MRLFSEEQKLGTLDVLLTLPVPLPALVLGPGDIAQAHAVDEWVALEQLGKAQALYAKVIKNDG